jgi:hypothetical protein
MSLNQSTAGQQRDNARSTCPVMSADAASSQHTATLLALYGEVCNSWRMLTDVRFKLLGFVPAASTLFLVSLLSKSASGEGLSLTSRLAICAVGLSVTLGLAVYDRRNMELYNELINRGRQIEVELGVHTGQFRGRPAPRHYLINHSNAMYLIYVTAIAAWLFAAVAACAQLL